MSTTLRFHRSLYPGESVDEAIKIFAAHASFERAEESEYWTVTVTPKRRARERALLGEFANYALGLAIRKQSAP